MDKKVLFAEIKIYASLYLMTAPFIYLAYKAGNIHPTEDFILLNIFIALSLWVYVKKIHSLLGEKGINKMNVLLFLLVTTAVFFSLKSVTLSSVIESEVSSIGSDLYELKSDLSELKEDVSRLKIYHSIR